MNMTVKQSQIATALPVYLKTIPKQGISNDPAFQAIGRHWKTIEKLYDPKRGKSIWNDRCAERMNDATCILLATRPTTRAGLLAWLSYLSERSVKGGVYLGEEKVAISTVLQSIEASCIGLISGTPPSGVRSAAVPHSDAGLLAKAEKLKKLFAQWMILMPACQAKWRKVKEIVGDADKDQEAYSRRFAKASVRTGYRVATRSRTGLAKKIRALARAMLKAPAHTAEGWLAQGAAAITFDDTFWNHIESGDGCFEAQQALWRSVHAAGFPVPAWVRRCAPQLTKPTARAA
jgi:hypothetical protein